MKPLYQLSQIEIGMTLDCLGQPNASVMYINLETCVRLIRALCTRAAPSDPSMTLANQGSNARLMHSTQVVDLHWKPGATALVWAWSAVLPSGAWAQCLGMHPHARKPPLAIAIAYPSCRVMDT